MQLIEHIPPAESKSQKGVVGNAVTTLATHISVNACRAFVFSGSGPVFNMGTCLSHLLLFHVTVLVKKNKKTTLGDKQDLSGGGLAAVSRPKSGTAARQII